LTPAAWISNFLSFHLRDVMKNNIRSLLSRAFVLAAILSISSSADVISSNAFSSKAWAECPFCSAVSQTLRQEMNQMDAAGIAVRVAAESESISIFEVERVLKGEGFIAAKQQFRMNYFGQAPENQRFLVMGIDPPDLLWSSPLQVSEKAIAYIDSVVQLPDDKPVDRLRFYLQFLDENDPVLKRDVYDEFASASYADMIQLKDEYDRRWLLDSVKDVDLPPDRRRLYLVMLGISGIAEDADHLESMLRSEDPNQKSGLDALIACFLSLKGADGLPVINELYLSNLESSYADTYAAIMALRFHGTDGGVIDREPIIKSLRLILERPELADLVIPDLARWEDWSVLDKMADLFKSADEKSSWVRVPVINYLRACPLPKAIELLDELKQIDPVAFRRATQFFPVPQPSDSESSRRAPPTSQPGYSGRRLLLADVPTDGQSASRPSQGIYAAATDRLQLTGGFSPQIERRVNPFSMAGVITTSCTTVWLAMWLAINGVSLPLARSDRTNRSSR
jgi:hypothetical protein